MTFATRLSCAIGAAVLGLAAIAFATAQPGGAGAVGTAPPGEHQPGVRFGYVDVFIDSGEAPLAVYQVELRATSGDIRIVGIEGGDPAAFADPPRYDPAALVDGERIVLGAFSTAENLPTGANRVARVHVRVDGPSPELAASIQIAGNRPGDEIDASVSTVLRSGA